MQQSILYRLKRTRGGGMSLLVANTRRNRKKHLWIRMSTRR